MFFISKFIFFISPAGFTGKVSRWWNSWLYSFSSTSTFVFLTWSPLAHWMGVTCWAVFSDGNWSGNMKNGMHDSVTKHCSGWSCWVWWSRDSVFSVGSARSAGECCVLWLAEKRGKNGLDSGLWPLNGLEFTVLTQRGAGLVLNSVLNLDWIFRSCGA